MPVYCYKCYDCDHYEEIRQSISDAPITVCTRCGGNFRRVIRNVGIIFKGSGFHITDYKGSKKASSETAATAGKTADTAASASKKEEKKAKSPGAAPSGSEKAADPKP